MRAIDPRCGRQPGQPLQRAEHLRRGAFEQAAAAGAKQSVATEKQVCAIIADMPERMPRQGQDLQLQLQRSE